MSAIMAGITALSFNSGLEGYQRQAEELLDAWRAGDTGALQIVHQRHPRFLDERIRWLPKKISEAELRGGSFDLADAQLTVARWYSFADWQRLADYVGAVTQNGSRVARFEAAVEAVINGDLPTLERLLGEDPELVRARSTRVTPHDPPVHRATVLHYIAANGVEGYRQKTPSNAAAVATMLLKAGAEPDA